MPRRTVRRCSKRGSSLPENKEIERRREQADAVGNVRRLPAARGGTAVYGSCS